MLFVKEHHAKQREGVMKRLKDMQEQYKELTKHRDEVNQALIIFENEFYRIEGELRMLEEMGNYERTIAAGLKNNKK